MLALFFLFGAMFGTMIGVFVTSAVVLAKHADEMAEQQNTLRKLLPRR